MLMSVIIPKSRSDVFFRIIIYAACCIIIHKCQILKYLKDLKWSFSLIWLWLSLEKADNIKWSLLGSGCLIQWVCRLHSISLKSIAESGILLQRCPSLFDVYWKMRWMIVGWYFRFFHFGALGMLLFQLLGVPTFRSVQTDGLILSYCRVSLCLLRTMHETRKMLTPLMLLTGTG